MIQDKTSEKDHSSGWRHRLYFRGYSVRLRVEFLYVYKKTSAFWLHMGHYKNNKGLKW